jgi:hypothetical protein
VALRAGAARTGAPYGDRLPCPGRPCPGRPCPGRVRSGRAPWGLARRPLPLLAGRMPWRLAGRPAGARMGTVVRRTPARVGQHLVGQGDQAEPGFGRRIAGLGIRVRGAGQPPVGAHYVRPAGARVYPEHPVEVGRLVPSRVCDPSRFRS